MTQADMNTSQVSTLTRRSKGGKRCAAFVCPFETRLMARIGHGRRPRQGVVHLSAALGTGAYRRSRRPRETRSPFRIRLRIPDRIDGQGKGTPGVDRGRDSSLYCRARKRSEKRRARCRIRRRRDTWRKWLPRRSVPSNNVQHAHRQMGWRRRGPDAIRKGGRQRCRGGCWSRTSWYSCQSLERLPR